MKRMIVALAMILCLAPAAIGSTLPGVRWAAAGTDRNGPAAIRVSIGEPAVARAGGLTWLWVKADESMAGHPVDTRFFFTTVDCVNQSIRMVFAGLDSRMFDAAMTYAEHVRLNPAQEAEKVRRYGRIHPVIPGTVPALLYLTLCR